jgi:acetylornithine/succinyldiaminopimelate/putrescine aminotransferase
MQLLNEIKQAFAAVNEAEAAVNEAAKAARDELVSRAKTLGLLLLDAHKLHPTRAKFQSFLKQVKGLGLSRAYDFMAVAGGRTTVEKLREQATSRKRKSRANNRSNPAAIPSQSVTDPNVTESARALAEFTFACQTWLPKITDEADRQLVIELTTPKAEAA